MPGSFVLQHALDALRFRNIGPTRGGRVDRRGRRPARPRRVLLRRRGRRRVEDRRRRHDLALHHRRPARRRPPWARWPWPTSAPNVLYAGMGETTIRTDVSHGDGVYKSTDGGRTWRHLGLADTRHIGQGARPPAEPGPGLRGGAGPRLRPQRGTRGLPFTRRRRDLGEGALQERPGRRRGPEHRPAEPRHPLRQHLAVLSQLLGAEQRRPRQRPVALQRRRRRPGRRSASTRASRRRSRARSAWRPRR